MTLDKRVERNILSVMSLQDFLRDVIRNPVQYLNNDKLCLALKSQGTLSKFSDESRGIYASSLNTIKRIAEYTLDGGFDTLNRLRLGAQDAIADEKSKGKRSNKTNVTGLRMRVNELEQKNQQLQQDLLLLTLLLEKALMQGKSYAQKSADESIRVLCIREQHDLLDMLSLQQHPIATNVTKIHD
jgi:hypothetical protein